MVVGSDILPKIWTPGLKSGGSLTAQNIIYVWKFWDQEGVAEVQAQTEVDENCEDLYQNSTHRTTADT